MAPLSPFLVLIGTILVALLSTTTARANALPTCAFEAPSGETASKADVMAAHFTFAEPRRIDGRALEEAIRAGKPGALTLRNLVVEGDLKLDELEVGSALEIEDMVVHGQLSLRDVHARRVAIRRARVQGRIVLDGLRTDRDVAIEQSALCGGANAAHIAVGNDFSVITATVCATAPVPRKERSIEPLSPAFVLSSGHVGGDLRFESVKAVCPVSIRAFRSGARILLKDVELVSIPETDVLDMRGVETQSGVFISSSQLGDISIVATTGGVHTLGKTHLHGHSYFGNLTNGQFMMAETEVDGLLELIDSNLTAAKIVETQTRGFVSIAGTKTIGMLNAMGVKAYSPWQLIGIASGSLVWMAKTEFLCEKNCDCDPDTGSCDRNQFVSIEAKGGISFSETTFGRPTLIGNINDASMLNCDRCVFAKPFEIYSAHFSGLLEMNNAQFQAPLTFIDVKASQLGIEKPQWTVPREKVQFRSVEFNRLDLGQNDPSFDRVFDLLDHVSYNHDFYESAAQHVQHEGRADIARDLRITSARRELGEGRKAAGGWLRYAWRAFLYVTIGGGVAPERAFILLFGLLLYGTWLYRDKSLMLWRGRAAEPHYSAFWYTVDLLLPVMKLDEARDWSPLPTERGRIYTSRVMRVVGFMMVPLLLAAATGLVR